MKSSEKTAETDALDLEGDLPLSLEDVAQNRKPRVHQGDVSAYLEFLEEIRAFEGVKNRAESLLRRERLRETRVKWMDELKEKYPVEIDEEMIKSI